MIDHPVKLEFDFGGWGKAFRANICTDARLQVERPFCAVHPTIPLNSDGFCGGCRDYVVTAVLDYLNDPRAVRTKYMCDANDSGTGYPYLELDCAKINHSHECECHLGHDCAAGCDVHDMRNGDDLGNEPHALHQLASESPSGAMLGVYERLDALEKANRRLRELVERLSTGEEIA